MQTIGEMPQAVSGLLQRSTDALRAVMNRLVPRTKGALLRASHDLLADHTSRGVLYLLTEGNVALTVGGDTIFIFEAGDIIGLEQCFGLADAALVTEFAVRADEYHIDDLLAQCADAAGARQWTESLMCQLHARTLMVGALGGHERNFTPEIKNYPAGSTIITEGDNAEEVYTLLEGTAEVSVKGVKVGDVLQDEIFGALATLTSTPRTASVVAKIDCLVLSLRRDKFLDLIQRRPATVLGMVENMARAIVSLNERVLSLSKGHNAPTAPLAFAKG